MDWIERIKSDADKALSEIYKEEQTMCLEWIKKNSSLGSNDGKEVFQTAVIILYDNVMSGKLTSLTGKISTYLIAICKNKCREFHRRQKRFSTTSEFPLLADHIETDVEEKKKNEILLSSISRMLNKMGDPCKSILQLFFYQKMKMEDICQLMGYNNVATTKNQKYKCLKRLQKMSKDIKV